MTEFTPVASTIGGLLIGLASITMLALNGRIAGISGIVGGLIDAPAQDRSWRVTFVLGLLAGGLFAKVLAPQAFGHGAPVDVPWLVVAGLLVGFGTRFGSGCTSGHGVCGISRLSPRSILATLTFMATGAATVFAVRALGGL
ncbi:MAG: YeeE/YedE family protein [Myxococcales bacterium]|nr:YeeE/YedE family protein [Myxococcales bacterium]MCB9718469.1 YeeE/YedE family protein [Myxococcales bacterium]